LTDRPEAGVVAEADAPAVEEPHGMAPLEHVCLLVLVEERPSVDLGGAAREAEMQVELIGAGLAQGADALAPRDAVAQLHLDRGEMDIAALRDIVEMVVPDADDLGSPDQARLGDPAIGHQRSSSVVTTRAQVPSVLDALGPRRRRTGRRRCPPRCSRHPRRTGAGDGCSRASQLGRYRSARPSPHDQRLLPLRSSRPDPRSLHTGLNRSRRRGAPAMNPSPKQQKPAIWLQHAATTAAIVGGTLIVAFTAVTTVPLMMRPDPMLGLELIMGLVFTVAGLAALAAAWRIARGSPSAGPWGGAAAIALLLVGGLLAASMGGGFSTAREAGAPPWLLDVGPWLILASGAGLLVLATLLRPAER